MRVATWNVQHGRPNPDGVPDIEATVDALRTLDADVWALQELDRGRRRSGRTDQPTLVAAGLGGHLVFAPTVHRGGEYGIGLVVRGEVVDSVIVPLSGSREPRALLLTEVEVGGSRWTVGCTHLSRRRAFAQRQLVAVFDAMATRPPPRVLVGDLNLIPPEILPWSTAEGYQVIAGAPTHSTRQPNATRRIDHVLVQGAAVTGSGVARRLPVSDHLAVWADLT
jgi:endonuclease/exonuclease/phosphatase family metal-dependent hydrolase